MSADRRLPLDGRVALVTGGARGIGRAIAQRLAHDGARVVIADVLDGEGTALAAELAPPARFVRHDVSREDDWGRTARILATELGGLDVLVNNAGRYGPRPLAQETADGFMDLVRVNQLGAFLGMRMAAELMDGRGGSIVNLSSTSGLRGYAGTTAYAATKWAIRGMTKVAAVELAPKRIRVNSVHPGLSDTAMAYENPPELLEHLTDGIPLRRLGRAEEIAASVAFLASDESSYVTGAELVVDGGAVV
jgi:3alpha(or 20beta)-hydroxysteroid dehydrogenase